MNRNKLFAGVPSYSHPTSPPLHTHTHTHGDRVGEDPRNEVETESDQVGIAKNIFASNWLR